MKKKITFLLMFVLSLSMVSAQGTFRFGTSATPEGKTLLVDSKGLILDGKHIIPVMGEIHYSRVPESEWRREIRKMKAGGINIISTYIFWIHHEPEEGKWNWSGNHNLRCFVRICAEENVMLVLRLGPFCHGEVYQGGIPSWVHEKAGQNPKYKIRARTPGFLEDCTELYNTIFAQVNGLLWKDGGPVVGVQIENESRGPWDYLEALKNIAVKAGFDVPFYTRTGWPALRGKEVFGQLLPLYGDYADGFWDRKLEDMPGSYADAFIMRDKRMSSAIATETFSKEELSEDSPSLSSKLSYPYFTCELGGGMMPAYHRRININGKELKPLVICKLGSGSNLPGYYMYHGGTNPYNPLHTMGETQASPGTNHNDLPHMTYDFQAPLGEVGQVFETPFHEGRFIHQMLTDWGSELLQMNVDSLSRHYARRGAFEFYNDYVRIKNESGTSHVTFKDYRAEGATIDWTAVEPFCKVDDLIYFIEIKGKKPQISVDGKVYTCKLNKQQKAGKLNVCVLSYEKAKTAYKIDGKLLYAKNGGILYKSDSCIVEEVWTKSPVIAATVTEVKKADAPRVVPMGRQAVAAQPVEEDFAKAAVYTINYDTSGINNYDNLFLRINYRGDVARVYADGRLVADNFWNGKEMWVRMADLVGKKVELKILPLRKDAPVYFQKEQKAMIEAAKGDYMLGLDSVEVIERHTLEFNDTF